MKKILISSFLSMSILLSGCSDKTNSDVNTQNEVSVSFPSSIVSLNEEYVNEIKNETGVYDVIVDENSTKFLLSSEKLEEFKKHHILETDEYISYIIETYPSVENISYSEDLSEFIVYVSPTYLTEQDKKTPQDKDLFYPDLIKQGLLYQPFLKDDISNIEIVVNFLDGDEVIKRIVANSNDYLSNS